MISWHRLFGLALTDLFTNTAYHVELEKDLSLKQQFLDVIIIEKNKNQVTPTLPDGLDNLAEHNLLTYKSYQESLNEWALQELIGHYVNYRKQISPAMDQLFLSDQFSLYAVTTRYPQKLLSKIESADFKDGYIDVYFRSLKIRIIVLSRIAHHPKNAFWQLFSNQRDNIIYGTQHYNWQAENVSTVMNQLYEKYQLEGFKMSYTMEDYLKSKDHFDALERMAAMLTPEQRLAGMKPEQRLAGMKPEELLQALSKLLSAEQIKTYLVKLEQEKLEKH